MACLFLLLLISLASSHEIEHVVVMMLENRAFDHLLGYYGQLNDTRVDGLSGNECNPKNLSDPTAGKICVNDKAEDHCAYDPDHSFARTTERVFACEWEKTPNTPCTNMTMTDGVASMTGFASSAIRESKTGINELSMWPPHKVPIITTLAQEFALFDRFFASHPGSTYPNRQFVLSATAHGMTDTGNKVPKGGFPQKTVLRSFEEANMSWRMYYEDSLAWAIFLGDVQNASSKPFLQQMSQFYEDTARGNLSNFTFLEPRIHPDPKAKSSKSLGLANHQHPQSSVQEGERWMKNVYEAVRNGPLWEKTLLLITYDEHGGFYDHVAPPQTDVPSPDGICTKEGFNYERLGAEPKFEGCHVSCLMSHVTHAWHPPTSDSDHILCVVCDISAVCFRGGGALLLLLLHYYYCCCHFILIIIFVLVFYNYFYYILCNEYRHSRPDHRCLSVDRPQPPGPRGTGRAEARAGAER
jgi:phospholipase C